jgi:CubicO group peptidase (beta-lactamase class C family)
MIRALSLTTCALLGCSVFGLGQQPVIQGLDGRPIRASQGDDTVERLMREAHVTGAGVALFHAGQITYVKAYGYRDREQGLPLTPDSVLASASLTKPAFATLVMLLVQDRVIDLDKPVYLYLPNPLPGYPQYADLKDDDRYRKLTLRILLSHRSGLPNWRGFEDDRKLRIHFEPGSRYAYSGEGIELAQFVVETVTHKSVTEMMDEKLFQPLGRKR